MLNLPPPKGRSVPASAFQTPGYFMPPSTTGHGTIVESVENTPNTIEMSNLDEAPALHLNNVAIDQSQLGLAAPPASDQLPPPDDLSKENMASSEQKGKESERGAPLSLKTNDAATPGATSTTAAAPSLSRLDSAAIGPSTEESHAPQSPTPDAAAPVCIITLLLTSGARHPYKIDERYLAKRNVTVPGTTPAGKIDPFSISVYTLKELILREWRDEWENRPTSPSSIRLIHFGRLLDDKAPLKGIATRWLLLGR